MRPPMPRYENTYPNIVLTYIKTLNNDEISLERLTQKLAVLLALATGQRIQTLSLIHLNNIYVYSEKVEIKISNRIKTSSINKPQPFLVLPFF